MDTIAKDLSYHLLKTWSASSALSPRNTLFFEHIDNLLAVLLGVSLNGFKLSVESVAIYFSLRRVFDLEFYPARTQKYSIRKRFMKYPG